MSLALYKGPGAPDDIDEGCRTQAWLAAGDDPAARVTGRYFYHMGLKPPNPRTRDATWQDRLVALCAGQSGVTLPA